MMVFWATWLTVVYWPTARRWMEIQRDRDGGGGGGDHLYKQIISLGVYWTTISDLAEIE